MHLTYEQLNEYLDNESGERARIETHLSACDECTARLTALQNLFAEIEVLPEVALSRDLASPFTRQSNLPVLQLPRWLTLTTTLQAVTAVIATIVFAPLVMQWVLPYLSSMQAPTYAEIFIELQSQWMVCLDLFSKLQMSSPPEIPVVELSSLVIVLTLAGVSILWLVGNGLLLRNQMK